MINHPRQQGEQKKIKANRNAICTYLGYNTAAVNTAADDMCNL